MKNFFYLLILILTQEVFANSLKYDSGQVINLLNELAKSKEMEFVIDEKFPMVNPYGSYGSSFVWDFISNEEIVNSVFFLARKKHESYKNLTNENSVDLIRNYDYFYIYAIQLENTAGFLIKDIISEGVGLKGVSLFYGSVDIKSKSFKIIESNIDVDSNSIDHRKLSTPILISSESSTQILYNYDDKWIISNEVEL